MKGKNLTLLYTSFLRKNILFGLFLCVILTIYACKCNNTDCINGICRGGECRCDPGYEGANCDVYAIEKFIGNYNTSQTCNTGPAVADYIIEITESNGDAKIVNIYNLYRYGLTVQGTVAEDQLAIARQSLNASEVEGTGTIDIATSTVSLNYTIFFPDGTSRTCSATLVLN